MHFLIDFENVHSGGLRGCDMLRYTDRVTLFYSDAAPRVESGPIREIMVTGAKLTCVKLKTAGKNALDFYITTYLGEIFGKGYSGPVGIVSKDGGFQATVEFWSEHTPEREVVVAGTVLEAMKKAATCSSLPEAEKERCVVADAALKPVKIGEACTVYGAARKKRIALMEQAGVDYGTADRVLSLAESGMNGRALYNALVKMMGRAAGQELYKAIRGDESE